MQVTKQLIDEFESEYPLGEFDGYVEFEPNEQRYRFTDIIRGGAIFCEKQTARLEVWLKQREKLEEITRNVRSVEEQSDCSVLVVMSSCRTAGLLKKYLQASPTGERA